MKNSSQILNFTLLGMNLSGIYTLKDKNDYLSFFISNLNGMTHSAWICETDMIYTKQT